MPNLIYQNQGTAITWLASAGTEPLTLTSLAAGAGRQGDFYDFGVGARAAVFAWRFWCKFNTTPVVGEAVNIYIKTSDGTSPDNDDGVADAAVSAENKLRNLQPIGTLQVDEASTTPVFAKSGLVYLPQRYVAPVIWNRTADALSSTAADHGFSLTPVPAEIQ